MSWKRRCAGPLVVGSTALSMVLAAGPALAATPQPPNPPPSPLAVDPSTVTPSPVIPDPPTNCPPAPSGVKTQAPGTGKRVALTFDDGPGTNTSEILQILKEEGVTATFFNIGVNDTVQPTLVKTEAAQGFLVGNHTWSHPDMTTQSASAQAAQMDDASDEQIALVGSAPCFFRPPYGAYDSTTLSLAQARNMAVYTWSVDTLDWQAVGSADPYWVNRIISLAEGGVSQTDPVILMHNQPNAMPATVAALRPIIDFYRQNGYTFVDLNGHSIPAPVQPGTPAPAPASTDRHVVGDWDGNRTVTPGVVRGSTWYLRNSDTGGAADVSFVYGNPGDEAVVGDWDGNRTVTPGVVRGNTWYLRNSDTSGPADVTFTYGDPTDRHVVGDWDGNGSATPGVVRGNTWYLRNSDTSGAADVSFVYGNPGDEVVFGDWDGNGTVTPGVVRGNTWYLRNSDTSGPADVTFTYGDPTDRHVVGDWDGSGTVTPGVTRGNSWYLRNSNSSGAADVGFAYGN